jgi:hypothetical protein
LSNRAPFASLAISGDTFSLRALNQRVMRDYVLLGIFPGFACRIFGHAIKGD